MARLKRRAASATELALLLPLLVPIGLSVTDYTRALDVNLAISQALETGAKFASKKGFASDQFDQAKIDMESLVNDELLATLPFAVDELNVNVALSTHIEKMQLTQISISCRVPLLFTWAGFMESPQIADAITVRRFQ